MVWPLLAGMGWCRQARQTRPRAAAAGVGEAHDGLGGADRAHAMAAGETGGDVLDDGQQLRAVFLEPAPGLS
jgi:hypothetical protein